MNGQLGPRLANSAIVAEWTLGKVQRVARKKGGGRYFGAVFPVLTGVRNPVPVQLTSDGALLVGDWATGAVYRISRIT